MKHLIIAGISALTLTAFSSPVAALSEYHRDALNDGLVNKLEERFSQEFYDGLGNKLNDRFNQEFYDGLGNK